MNRVSLAVCVGLVLSLWASAADDEAKKQVVGRWAPVVEKSAARAVPKTKAAARPASKSKVAARPKSTKGRAGPAAQEPPKALLEFTADGKVRLDGDTSALVDLAFLKPLADFDIRVSPEAQDIKITYKTTGDDQLEVAADHTWLLEKLGTGGTTKPSAEVLAQYRPRETFKVVVDAGHLTLTNAEGKTMTFRRHAGLSIDEMEAQRRGDDARATEAPFEDVLRKQGIRTGPPAKDKTKAAGKRQAGAAKRKSAP
jgi:hypothetical protein